MATHHDDDPSPADHGVNPPAETEAKTSPDPAAEKPAKPSPEKSAKPAAAKPAVKPAAKPAAAAGKEANPSADKPAKSAPDKAAAKPPAAKIGVKAVPEKRTKPAAPAPKEEKPAEESEEETAPAADKEAEAPAGDEKEDKPAKETAVQTEAAVKGKSKKKAKTETGIATKAGLSSFFNFSKAPPTGVWGVDLGQCALKAVRLEIIDGEVTATAFDYVEHPKILSQPDADPDELTREALQKFLSRNILRGDTVAISVPGQSGLARFVKLPPVEEKKIPDIVRFEAKQQIPFNLDEVVWDYQKLGVSELAAGFVETEIGLFAMKRDMVNRYLQHFKDVGVEVHLVQMAPLALCNFVAYDLLGRDSAVPASEEAGKPKKHCITALDIGADSSNLVITDGARIIWQRPIPLGGNHFTRALTKDLKLTFAKAEHLKRNAVKSPDLKKILASLKPVLSDFVGEVQRSLGYFTNTHRDAQIGYMIGLGNAFRLPGLQRFLAEKLQMEVRKLGKMERLTGDSVVTSATYTENILSFAVAYGLALQGLKRTKLQTNLLPGEIRAERAVRGKKPWAIAAAALLLVGLAGFAATGACNYYSYAGEPLPTREEEAKAVADKAKAAQDKFDAAKAAAAKEEEAVKSIVAGQAERKHWLEMTRYLFTEAVPNPDPDPQKLGRSNVSATAEKKYFVDGGGAQAFKDLQKRWSGQIAGEKDASGKPVDSGADLGPSIGNLVQVNIEFFDQRYCDDLGAAWKQIKETAPLIKNNAADLQTYTKTGGDPDKAPVGKGWIVEIHGSTYHTEPKPFLVDTLVDNIYRLSVKPGAPADAKPAPPNGTPAGPANGSTTPAPKTEPPSDKDVYLGHISNVVLFDAETVSHDKPSIVGQSVLDKLATPGGASGGTNTPGGPMTTSGGTGSPMNSPNTGGTGGPMNSPNGSGASSGAGGATAAGGAGFKARDDWKPLSSFIQSGAANQAGDAGKGKEATHKKTEFVIVFLWQEPTPSDKDRGEDPNAKPAAAPNQGMTPGGQPMSQPGGGGTPPPAEDKPLSAKGDLGS